MWTMMDFMTYSFFYFLLLVLLVVGVSFTMYFLREKKDIVGAGASFVSTVIILSIVVNLVF